MQDGGFFRHLFLLMATAFGLLGVPLPLPLPPLPEDPALLRVAPADSLLFVEWFGGTTATADARNHTEQLAAEPEVRTLVQKLLAASRGVVQQELAKGREGPGLLSLFDLTVSALQRPGCAFVVRLQPFAAGLVVAAGDEADKMATTFASAFDLLKPSDLQVGKESVGGVDFRTLKLPDDAGNLGWATIDGYFAVTVGEGAPKQIVAGLRQHEPGLGGAPPFQQLRGAVRVERPVLRTYVAVASLLEHVPLARGICAPLGLASATSALAESGLEGDGFVSRLRLLTAETSGVLGALAGEPLAQDDLALVPDDATVALALRARKGGLERVFLALAGLVARHDVAQDWDRSLDRGKEATGIHIRGDLIAHADDRLVAWSAPSQGGLLGTAAVAAVRLRDGKTFARNLQAMWEQMTHRAPNKADERASGNRLDWHHAYLEHFEHAGRTVWWVDLMDRSVPLAFTWTSTDRHFLLGLLPQPVRSAIDASLHPDLEHSLVRIPAAAPRGNATAMLYFDLRGILVQAYPAALLLLQANSLSWQRDGFDFDLADVPRLQALLPHVGPETLRLEPATGSLQVTRTGSLPVFDPLLVGCVAACLLMVD